MATALGIDVGSSNVKVAVVGDDGTIFAAAERPLMTRRAGESATQDAEALWDAVASAVREVTAAAPGEIAAVGVASQYSSLVGVDRDGLPTTDLVMWLDRRGTAASFEIMARHPEAFETWIEHHGIPTVGAGLALGHLLHLVTQPSHEGTTCYLEPMDYVVSRLTGVQAASQHTMFMSQLCDNRSLAATAYDPELVAMAAVDPAYLPTLVPVGSEIGPVTRAVADQLHLTGDPLVFAGTNDTATAAVATGAFRPERGGLSIGTTTVLIDAIDRMAGDLDHEILSMPGPFVDGYLVWAENGLGGKVVEHLLTEVIHGTDLLGDHRTDAVFAAFDAALDAVPPGANGVVGLPWFNGSLSPASDPDMRGGFVNMGLDTRRIDLVRAAAEGVAHNLAWLLPHVEAFTGEPIAEIVFVGGAARSRSWCQILADITGKPVLPVRQPESAVCRATGLLALHHRGILTRADLDEMVPIDDRFEPDDSHRELYVERQLQFESIFTVLRPIMSALNSRPADKEM